MARRSAFSASALSACSLRWFWFRLALLMIQFAVFRLCLIDMSISIISPIAIIDRNIIVSGVTANDI